MNGKKALVCAILLVCFNSCATLTRHGADPTILEHQKRIAELEAANSQLINRLDKYDFAIGASVEGFKALGERAKTIEGSVDGIIRLFEQYEYEVERLLRAYQYAAGTSKSSQ